MRVIVSPIVREKVKEFYRAAMINHPLLSERVVIVQDAVHSLLYH